LKSQIQRIALQLRPASGPSYGAATCRFTNTRRRSDQRRAALTGQRQPSCEIE
jgi:hypothetical protein